MAGLIDCHVHLERGPYTLEWVNKFVKQACNCGLSEIYLLEHTHRFKEFRSLYETMASYNSLQNQWYAQKGDKRIEEYIALIDTCKNVSFPISVKFGLEVCYEPGHEDLLDQIPNLYPFDFLVGSVHWIDGFSYDISSELWKNRDVNFIYQRYYDLILQSIECDLFTGIAHPDAIKCFEYYPTINLENIYLRLAEALKAKNKYVEDNAGLRINYGHWQLGMSPQMRTIFKKYGICVKTASDAHSPEQVGAYIKELHDYWK